MARSNFAARFFGSVIRTGGSLGVLAVAGGLALAPGAAGQCLSVASILRPTAQFEHYATNGHIAVSADGQTMVVGDSGLAQAYFFRWTGGAWSRQATFAASGLFGRGVALSADGNTAVVSGESPTNSAAIVEVFTRTAGVWSLSQTITYNGPGGGFGHGLCMSADASTLFVGQHGGTSDRCVHVYTRSGGSYTHTTQLIPSSDTASSNFSQHLGCSADGNTVAAAAVDRTFVFTRSGQAWSERQILSTPGTSPGSVSNAVTVNADGSRIFVGKPDRQMVYVFTAAGPAYTLSQILTPTESAGAFGAHVATDAAGTVLLVGAPQAWSGVGAVYAYGESAGWWDRMAPRIDAPQGLSGGSAFGTQIALAGTVAVVGAGNDGSGGALCWFTMPASSMFAVTDPPVSAQAQPGGQAMFHVGVTPGASVTYTWRRNGEVLLDGPGPNGVTVAGSNGATLTLNNVHHADNGAVLDCIVRAACTTIVTPGASLLVGADCPTDFNGDGFVDFFDYDDFVAAFEAGC